MKLGMPEVSLKVESVKQSIRFYTSLGFVKVEGDEDEAWVVVEHSGVRIGLYEGHIPCNSITFFGGDVDLIVRRLRESGYAMESDPQTEDDGSVGATIRDPDGNLLYFNS